MIILQFLKFLVKNSIIIIQLLFLLSFSSLLALEKNQKYDFYGKDGQNFKGAVFIREEKKAYIIRMYYSDQEIRIFKKDLLKLPKPSDKIAPTVKLIPKADLTINTLTTIKLIFSEPVLMANKIDNYRLEGSGRNKLSIEKIVKANNKQYLLKLKGKPGNGKVILYLDNIVDKAGNLLQTKKFSYELDTKAADLEAEPKNASRLEKLDKIILIFSKNMKGLEKQLNYSLYGDGLATLKIKSIKKLSSKSVEIKLQGKAQEGKINLSWKNISDITGNSPKSSRLSYTIGTPLPLWNDPSLENKTKSIFSEHLIMLLASYSNLSGIYSKFFPYFLALSLRWEYSMKYPYSRVPILNKNPIAPGLNLGFETMYFSANKRIISGYVPSLGPIWYFSFFPEKYGRFAFSFFYGFTILKISGQTFQGKLNANYLASELQYQFLHRSFIFGLFIRQMGILDSNGSIFSKSLGLQIGYTF